MMFFVLFNVVMKLFVFEGNDGVFIVGMDVDEIKV